VKFAVYVVNLQSESIMRFSETDRKTSSQEMVRSAVKIAMFVLLPTEKKNKEKKDEEE
jgi:hypothetical protein